jgi:hypothetical protein
MVLQAAAFWLQPAHISRDKYSKNLVLVAVFEAVERGIAEVVRHTLNRGRLYRDEIRYPLPIEPQAETEEIPNWPVRS